jgi:hypothetical protein
VRPVEARYGNVPVRPVEARYGLYPFAIFVVDRSVLLENWNYSDCTAHHIRVITKHFISSYLLLSIVSQIEFFLYFRIQLLISSYAGSLWLRFYQDKATQIEGTLSEKVPLNVFRPKNVINSQLLDKPFCGCL